MSSGLETVFAAGSKQRGVVSKPLPRKIEFRNPNDDCSCRRPCCTAGSTHFSRRRTDFSLRVRRPVHRAHLAATAAGRRRLQYGRGHGRNGIGHHRNEKEKCMYTSHCEICTTDALKKQVSRQGRQWCHLKRGNRAEPSPQWLQAIAPRGSVTVESACSRHSACSHPATVGASIIRVVGRVVRSCPRGLSPAEGPRGGQS